MEILTVYRSVLINNSAVAANIGSRVYLGRAPQNADRPNIILRQGGAGEEMTHSGPSGLRDAEIIVTSRGETAEDIGVLGGAVNEALTGWRGTIFGLWVQLTSPISQQTNYDDGAGVYEQINTYTAFYRKV